MKKIIILFLLAILALFIAIAFFGCKKDDQRPEFHVGQTVMFNDINPSASFIPLFVYCPCVITREYQKEAYYGWFYDLNDVNGNPVTNLYQDQIKAK